jgi:hypothetical protein
LKLFSEGEKEGKEITMEGIDLRNIKSTYINTTMYPPVQL